MEELLYVILIQLDFEVNIELYFLNIQRKQREIIQVDL